MEQKYSSACAQNIENTNLNDSSNNYKPKTRVNSIFYGNQIQTKSYAETTSNFVSKIAQTVTPQTTNANVIEDQSSQDEITPNIEEALQKRLDESIEAKIQEVTEKFNTQMNDTKNELSTEIKATESKLENMIVEKEKSFNEQIGTICTILKRNQEQTEKNADIRASNLRHDYNHLLEVITNSRQAPMQVEQCSRAGVSK